MSDYTITTDFSVKDALTTGDPEKIILGADFDVEFNAIDTAITSKFDSNDIASEAQAQAGSTDSTLISPAKLTDWSQAGTGVIEDLWGYADPNVDTLFGWDDSAGAAIGFTLGTGITSNLGAIEMDFLGLEDLTDPGADRILFWDDSAGIFTWLTVGTNLDITTTTLSAPTATLEAAISHDNLASIPANDHIDHTAVTITAGTGLAYSSGGTDISASATIDLSFLGIEALTDPNDDRIMFWDDTAGAMAWLDMGSSLAVTGTTLDVVYADIEANLSTATASLPIYAGYVDSAGTAEVLPSGWTATNDGTGLYTVTHNLGLTAAQCSVVANTNAAGTRSKCDVTSVGTNSFGVDISSDSGYFNDEFWFILVDFSGQV